MGDSIGRSVTTGRIAAPLAVLLGALITYFFGIEVSEEDLRVGLNTVGQISSGILSIYGIGAAIVSKIRQRRECDE